MKKQKPKKWKEPFCEAPKKKGKVKIKFSPPELKENPMFEQSIKNTEKIQGTLEAKKADGTLGSIGGTPVWEVVSGTSTVETSVDGLSAFLISSETNGDTVYKVTGSVDFGTGFKPFTVTGTLHVTDSGTPEEGTVEVKFGPTSPK